MNIKKILPILFFVILAIVAISLRRCSRHPNGSKVRTEIGRTPNTAPANDRNINRQARPGLDRNSSNLFFTKHARCRMACRHITQKEVREILAEGTINYNKSDLQDPKGPRYAVEGMTSDRQHVRIIFAENKTRISVVTVIDLETDYACDCK
jgi:hypothetical protein